MLFLLYNLLFIPAAGIYLLYFAFSRRRGLLKSLPAELRERMGGYPPALLEKLKGRPVVWFHAASLGEAKALMPLISRVKKEKPGHALVLTSSNIVAREQGSVLPELEASLLAPLDFYPFAARAVNALSPRVLVIAESELWPSLLRIAEQRGIEVAVANARMSRRSFRRLRRAKSIVGEMYSGLSLVAAQTAADARRFAELGSRADRVIVSGNLKYDRFFSESVDLAPLRARVAHLGWKPEEPVFVAGSTHAGEEDAVLHAFAAIKEKSPQARLLLAPRHIERLPEVEALLHRDKVPFALWSKLGSDTSHADVLLLDTVGILPGLYGLARAAFVGGTLAPKGGHNLLEPVRFSVPVLFGPYTDNVTDIAALLNKAGGCIQVQDADELATAASSLFSDVPRCTEMGQRARTAAETLRGATDRTYQRLKVLL